LHSTHLGKEAVTPNVKAPSITFHGLADAAHLGIGFEHDRLHVVV
jgi:hypothetical protein